MFRKVLILLFLIIFLLIMHKPQYSPLSCEKYILVEIIPNWSETKIVDNRTISVGSIVGAVLFEENFLIDKITAIECKKGNETVEVKIWLNDRCEEVFNLTRNRYNLTNDTMVGCEFVGYGGLKVEFLKKVTKTEIFVFKD